MFSLRDKVAIVTGAATGIGEAIAKCFACAEALVYVADIDAEGGERVIRQIRDSGGAARFAELDVTDETECRKLVDKVLQTHDGRIDVLVNNTGVGAVGTILDTPTDKLQRLWSVNVMGMFYLIKAVLPGMVERRRGSIINIASALGLQAMADRFAYTTTKHAVVGLTRSIAYDFGPTQVRINCICPGRVETELVKALLAEYPDPDRYRQQMCNQQAQKRMAQPEEIAWAALYLAADESAYVTGSAMVVDGGFLAGK